MATLLIARGARLSIAESVTAGRVQALVTSVSGASDFFEGGVVTYSLEQKVRILGVDRAHAEAVNCVSAELSQQMATGVSRLFRTEFALGITGYAEPDATHQIDIPQAHVAVWQAGQTPGPDDDTGRLLSHTLIQANEQRIKAQQALARHALAILLATLETME